MAPDLPQKTNAGADRHKGGWLIPVAFLMLYVFQCAWFIQTQSLTYDEPVHIAEGLDAWRNGRFQQYNDHPPLARLLCTLPLLASRWQVRVQQLDQGFRVTELSPEPESMARWARVMNVGLGIALAIVLWLAAARMFSPEAANFALALYAFSPALIAHFSLVTTDGAATLFIFVTAWRLVQWRKKPGWINTAIFGLILGLLLLAKFSTGVMCLLALSWMLVLGRDRVVINPLRWNWGKAVLAVSVCFLVVWSGYFFHVSHLIIRDGELTATFPNWTEPLHRVGVKSININAFIPAGEYVEGLREVARHNRAGQPAFFLGQTSQKGGWKLYYSAVILLKWPPIILGLALTVLLLLLLRKLKLPADLGVMLTFPVLYLAMAMVAHFNQGERHILPVYPFALLLTASLFDRLRQDRWGMALAIALVCLNIADVWRYAPGYLSYFTTAVKPEESYRLLSDSNLDWGQGLLALREYQREHPQERLHLAYFGSLDPAFYGIKTQLLHENEGMTGTVVVGVTNLSGQFLQDAAGYRWLLQHKSVAILDHSLFVFHIDSP